jgi:hypothetical protein
MDLAANHAKTADEMNSQVSIVLPWLEIPRKWSMCHVLVIPAQS